MTAAQRLAEIRGHLDEWGDILDDDATFLLDHIDTLTAKLAEVDAERDALQ
jgi:hypothetical protein